MHVQQKQHRDPGSRTARSGLHMAQVQVADRLPLDRWASVDGTMDGKAGFGLVDMVGQTLEGFHSAHPVFFYGER